MSPAVARAAANAAISHSRTNRDSTSSLTSVMPWPVMAQNSGRERNVERSQTKVPSPTVLSIMPISSRALGFPHGGSAHTEFLTEFPFRTDSIAFVPVTGEDLREKFFEDRRDRVV